MEAGALPPDPTGGAYSASSDSLAGWEGEAPSQEGGEAPQKAPSKIPHRRLGPSGFELRLFMPRLAPIIIIIY